MANVEILVKVIEESSDLKKIEEGFKDLEKATDKFVGTSKKTEKTFEMTEKKAKKLVKQLRDIGINTEKDREAFARSNPEIRAAFELLDNVGESGEKASKGVGSLKKQLTGLAKGFIGVTGAIVAGRAIAKFTKDSLAAADAAGLLPPIFKESEKSSDRLKVAVGTQLGKSLEGTVTVMTRMKNSTAANLELTSRIVEAERKGIITTREANILRVEQNKGMRSQVDVLGVLTEAERIFQEQREARRRAGAVGQIDDVALTQIEERERAAAAQAGVTARGPNVIPVEIVPFFRDLDLNIGKQIATAMAKIDFAEAGGDELVTGFRTVFEQVDMRGLGATLGNQLFGEMALRAEQIEVALGNITANQAARNIQNTLGVTFAEALALVRGVEDTIKRIGRLKVQARIEVQINTSGGGFGTRPGLAAGGPVTAGGTFLVGEQGPELFTPNTSGNITPNDELGGNTAALESEISGMRGDIRNMGLDIKQALAEAVG